MAFRNDEDREKARVLVVEGKLPTAEIVAQVGNGCKAQDIHNLRYSLKKASGAPPAAKRTRKPKSEKKQEQGQKSGSASNGSLAHLVEKEVQQLRGRSDLIGQLTELYRGDKSKKSFLDALEKEEETVNGRLTVGEDLLRNLQQG